MSSIRLIVASLLHHWRMNCAVACGVAVGTAVLTGALLVGDSMRASLRHLTIDRLGRIEQVLLSERFFRAELADELAAQPEFPRDFTAAVPVVMLNASIEQAGPPERQSAARASRVNLLGCDSRFWQLGPGGPRLPPEPDQIVLNEPLAVQLGVGAGDEVLLWLPRPGLIPGDTPLGKKADTVPPPHPLVVSAIIPAAGLGRFGLRPTQHSPRNAYVPLGWLQRQLGQRGRANAILVAGRSATAEPVPEGNAVLQRLLRPTADDYGLKVEPIPTEYFDYFHVPRFDYFNITSDRMLIEPAEEKAILQALGGDGAGAAGVGPTYRRPLNDGATDRRPLSVQPALTYLAITIACGEKQIPYSTITAIDFETKPPLGPWLSLEGAPIPALADDQIVLNAWAAEKLGDPEPEATIRVTYFRPESVHGELREKTEEFLLKVVAKLAAAADDRALTPSVPGVTDRLLMKNWEAPFPFQRGRLKKDDNLYWRDYGATPKAFVSLHRGRQLWGSRFGQTTSIRVRPSEGMTVEGLKQQLALDPATMGFVFQPVKQQGLAASAGTTPFNLLFLGFSMFIIAAAVMLVALMFRLGIERRAAQVGILLAVGFNRRQVVRLLAGEGLLVAAVGSLLGVAAGIGYAALMLLGLRTWWLAAVVTPFLRLYVSPTSPSLAIGYASGLIVAFAAIAWSVRRIARIAPRRLLAGQTYLARQSYLARREYTAGWIKVALLLISVVPVIPLLLLRMGEELRAVVFFAVGAFVLAIWLALTWLQLRAGATRAAVTVGRGNLWRMALRNAARNPGRSTLCIGLVAAACFLIVAVSAFRLDPTQQVPTLGSGNGGFALVAQSDQPIYQDLDNDEVRAKLNFSKEDIRRLAGTTTIALRVRPGDDASCLNLYRPQQPRVLGVPDALVEHDGFAWADAPRDCDNPWLLLQEKMAPDEDGTPRVPVILEKNTATYSLHLGQGLGETYDITGGRGQKIRLVIVALLANSIFQGDLLMGEEPFLHYFPELSGYQFFLFETTPAGAADVAAALERTLVGYGLAVETTGQRLAEFLAVQNTYLSTFQSLGGLGLLLGTIGLAAVQLRSVLERRGELALLRAAGFRRRTLATLVMIENALLLLAGLAVGVLAALVAVLPHVIFRTASIPWESLGVTLALVLAVGLIAGLTAVRAVLRAPLLPALREER